MNNTTIILALGIKSIVTGHNEVIPACPAALTKLSTAIDVTWPYPDINDKVAGKSHAIWYTP